MTARARAPRARAPRGHRVTTTGGVGGGDLGAAAGEIARGARELAAWSEQIATSISVDADEATATVWTEAGPAYPAETGARHPLFGNRGWWYAPSARQRPFLGPAADLRAGAAMARYAEKIDRLCRKAGFGED